MNKKTEPSLEHFPREIIFLIASSLDLKSLLMFREVCKLWEEVSRYLLINMAKDKIRDKIACGTSSVIFAHSNGKSWSWGDNEVDQLALGTSSMSKFATCSKPTEGFFKNIDIIVMGDNFSVGKTRKGTVFSSGTNDLGQLGLGNTKKYSIPKKIHILKYPTQIAAGKDFALALVGETLYSWGANDHGQLGHGDRITTTTPQVVSSIKNVKQISAGDSFSVTLTKNDEVYIWGNLGYSPENYLTPQLIPSLKGMVSISAGYNFILTLNKLGKVFFYGKNVLQQLGVIEIPTLEKIVKVSTNISISNHRCLALSKKGVVFSWSPAETRLQPDLDLPPPTPQKVVGLQKIIEIGQGENFSIALDWNGVGYSWGGNKKGQLGLGYKSDEPVTTPVEIRSFEKPLITQFIKSMAQRFAKERFAKASLKSEQKASLNNNLTFFSSKNENQFNKEIEELKQVLKDEKSSIVQLEDKMNNCLKLFETDSSKESLYLCIANMKEELSKLKPIIAKEIEAEAEAEVFSLTMKRT